VIGGVGVAALATGTIFMVQSRQDDSAARELCRERNAMGQWECASDVEEARFHSLVKDAKREQLIGLIGFGVGGAAMITAAVLLFTADDGSPGEQALSVSPLWTEAGWGASVAGSF
jgi:hypothetical protein